MVTPPDARFGVFCTGPALPAWQARCLENLLALPGTRLALVLSAAPGGHPAPGIASPRGSALWRWYRAHYVARRCRALRPVPLEALAPGTSVLPCRVECLPGGVLRPHEDDLAPARDADLDVLLYFGTGTLAGPVLRLPRHGIWAFDFAAEEGRTGRPPCFWEVRRGEDVAEVKLLRLGEGAGGAEVLQEAAFATVHYSYVRCLEDVLFGCADLPARTWKQIDCGAPAGREGALTPRPAPAGAAPSAGATAGFALTLLRNFALTLIDFLARDHRWGVGVVSAPAHAFLEPGARPSVRWLPGPGHGAWLADPFGLRIGEDLAVLAEVYDPRVGHGNIVALTLGPDGSLAGPREALATGSHLAYPYLFRHGGEVYCVPESAQVREVVLYRAVDFPWKWERLATLVEGFAGLDPTLFAHEGRWWLLCTDRDTGKDVKLHAWHAPTPLGPWAPHAANPVKSDVRSSRPAGRPFVHNGALYRPTQDCARAYGDAVAITRVLRLTPTEFEEEVVARVTPYPDGPYPDGLHTLTAVDGLTLVDGRRYVWSARGVVERVRYILRRVSGASAR